MKDFIMNNKKTIAIVAAGIGAVAGIGTAAVLIKKRKNKNVEIVINKPEDETVPETETTEE